MQKLAPNVLGIQQVKIVSVIQVTMTTKFNNRFHLDLHNVTAPTAQQDTTLYDPERRT
jgi:hypothetical protein